jgi:hypothetical protein
LSFGNVPGRKRKKGLNTEGSEVGAQRTQRRETQAAGLKDQRYIEEGREGELLDLFF